MKLLSTTESKYVSGGTIITVDGKKLLVNTLGIPPHCVNIYEAMANMAAIAAKDPNMSMSSLMTATAPYLDEIQRSNCDSYLADFHHRLQTAQRIS